MKKNIETEQRFGRLVIVKEVEHHKMPSGRYRRMFLCKCDCGNEVTCSLANLTSGNTSSCGCLKRELASKNNSTHHQSKTRLYKCWLRMRNRCYREENENYAYYGGRGNAIFGITAHSPIDLLTEMLDKLNEKGLLE